MPDTSHFTPFEPAPETLRRWADAATDALLRYHAGVRERRLAPDTSSAEIRSVLERALPEDGADFGDALRIFENDLLPFTRHSGHPRMFGYVQSPGVAVASLADLLASMVNANLTAWRSAPGPVELEKIAIEWIQRLLGVDTSGAGLFVSGGSMANFSALAVARGRKAPVNVAREGLHALPRAMRLYVSEETHHSVAKAAAMLGLGHANVRVVPVDDTQRLRMDALAAMVAEDRAAGHQPFCVVGTAGTVGTGAVDPLGEIAAFARANDLWFHVDACYGGMAAVAPSVRERFAALGEADSIALDPHKWMYLPIDCGCVLYRDPAAARATFAHDAEYTRVLERTPDETFAFWDYGPELSRRFRALKVWMVLRTVGAKALRDAVEKDLACAAHLAARVDASDDFERLAPVGLSIVCFRHVPVALRTALRSSDVGERERAERELDAHNERLLFALQRDGSSYLSNAAVRGRFAMRACVINHRTTLADMDVVLADLRRLAGAC